MRSQTGRYQLERAAALLSPSPYRRVLTRLVYVGYAADSLLPEVTGVRADDSITAYGVVWITPEEVEAAARDLGVALPR